MHAFKKGYRKRFVGIVGCAVISLLLSLFSFLPTASAQALLPQVPRSAALLPNDMYSQSSWGGLFGMRGGYAEVTSWIVIPCIGEITPSGEADIWIGLGGVASSQMVRAGIVLKNTWMNGSPMPTYSIFVQDPHNVVVSSIPCGTQLYFAVSTKGMSIQGPGWSKVYPVTPINLSQSLELVVEKPDGSSEPNYTLADFIKVQFADVQEFYVTPDGHMHIVDISAASSVDTILADSVDSWGNLMTSGNIDDFNDFTVYDLVRYPPSSYCLWCF